MSAEERAKELVEAQGDDLSRYQRMFLAQDIASAISEAVQAERLACAAVCDEQGQDVIGHWFGNEDYRRGANACGVLIRARAKGE